MKFMKWNKEIILNYILKSTYRFAILKQLVVYQFFSEEKEKEQLYWKYSAVPSKNFKAKIAKKG